MKKIKVFIGSSSKSKRVATGLQALLDDEPDLESTVWNQGVFSPSNYTLDDLLIEISRSDFAVLILGADDELVKAGTTEWTTRDNVIFETGLCLAKLGRDRTFMVCPKGVKPPSDLAGITLAMYDSDRDDHRVKAALGPASQTVIDAIRTIVAHSAGSTAQAGSSPNLPTVHGGKPSRIVDDGRVAAVLRSIAKQLAQIPSLAAPMEFVPIVDSELVKQETNPWLCERLGREVKAMLPTHAFSFVPVRVKGGRGQKAEPRTCDVSALDLRPGGVKVIFDDVSFSGTTVAAAVGAIRRVDADATILAALLFVSPSAKGLLTNVLKVPVIYGELTHEQELLFPWEQIRPTSALDARYAIHSPDMTQILRPWGWMDIICMNRNKCSVRTLNVNPKARLSFQRHAHRDELFLALDDNMQMELKDHADDAPRVIRVRKGEYIFIERGTYHRMSSLGQPSQSLEVAFGDYDQNDIERTEDDYDRPSKGDGGVIA